MLRFASPSILLAALLVAGPPTAVADFTGALSGLREELEARAESLAGTPDREGKKQLKAVQKALKALDKPADGIGDDIKAAGKSLKALRKGFPSEFGSSGAGASFGDLYPEILADLQFIVEESLAALEDGTGVLSAKGAVRVMSGLDRARGALDLVDEEILDEWVALIGKAWKEVLKGEKVIASDRGPPSGVTLVVDGMAVGGKTIEEMVVLAPPLPGIDEQLTFLFAWGGSNAQAVSMSGFFEEIPGADDLSQGSYVSPTFASYSSLNGSIHIVSRDAAARRVSFNFSFVGQGTLGTSGTVTVSGSYSGPYTLEIPE